MQMRLRKITREQSEEIVVECDRRNLRNVLLVASAGLLADGAWIFREALFGKTGGGVTLNHAAFAVWALSAVALALSLLWITFGRRTATFVTGEIRIHSTLGPLRLGNIRIYRLTNVGNVRLWFQGVNDGGWKTTERAIVFDHHDRTIFLFLHLPEHAVDDLFQTTRLHVRAAMAQ